MWYLIDWKWYTVLSLATLLTGAGMGWSLAKFEEAYKEAKADGAIA